jgi:hypothetical protein
LHTEKEHRPLAKNAVSMFFWENAVSVLSKSGT